MDNYIMVNTMTEYQTALSDIEHFAKLYPDNIDGYNYLIKIAKRYKQRLDAIGTFMSSADEPKLK
jgi:hypothetical protein